MTYASIAALAALSGGARPTGPVQLPPHQTVEDLPRDVVATARQIEKRTT